jgi:hypothetical protein
LGVKPAINFEGEVAKGIPFANSNFQVFIGYEKAGCKGEAKDNQEKPPMTQGPQSFHRSETSPRMLGILHGENITTGAKAQEKFEGKKTAKKVFDKTPEIWHE